MRFTVDRITEKYVVLQDENGVTGNVDKVLLPYVREGEILHVTTETDETEKKKNEMQERLHGLFRKGKNNEKN